MKAKTNISINASREAVWSVITDIEHAEQNIEDIVSVEVVEKPETGIVGLKWKETRVMFGKEVTETMWITEAEENSYYVTRAENHGAIYSTRLEISGNDGNVELSMEFGAQTVTIGAKIMYLLTAWMMKKSMVKALQKDLQDIKAVAEAQ